MQPGIILDTSSIATAFPFSTVYGVDQEQPFLAPLILSIPYDIVGVCVNHEPSSTTCELKIIADCVVCVTVSQELVSFMERQSPLCGSSVQSMGKQNRDLGGVCKNINSLLS